MTAPDVIRRNVLQAIRAGGKKSMNDLGATLPHGRDELYRAVKGLQGRGLLEKRGGAFRLTAEGKRLAPK